MSCKPLTKRRKKQLYWFLFFINILFIVGGCSNQLSPEAAQREADSLKKEFDSLNANSQPSNQATIDSINKAYLDSFSKHVDTNNAEFGNHR